jgi:hypothetical protein
MDLSKVWSGKIGLHRHYYIKGIGFERFLGVILIKWSCCRREQEKEGHDRRK